MSVAGFAVVAFMLTAYVILDGYDLGAALVSPLVARNERERSAVIATIGPFWNGNEVWLIAAGGDSEPPSSANETEFRRPGPK